MTGLLGSGRVGSHHGIAAHLIVNIDLDTLSAGIGGELTLPGSDDPVLLGPDAVDRLLCDAAITHLITRRTHHGDHSNGSSGSGGTDPASRGRGTSSSSVGGGGSGGTGGSADPDPGAGWRDGLADLLREHAVEVLWVGREHRSVTPRQRRALQARDRHCQAPGCRRHPRRCNAHHVQHWQDYRGTDLDNCVLICEQHHRAIHAGQLTITQTPGKRPTETGYWTIRPSERPTRT